MANIGNLPMLPPLTAAERAVRSVFVGNIPYEATEEQLKDIFIQAGPVISFRLVYDRETGKPKGYGFCEYQDIETAQSAMRNLNNYDFNGRPLRVGVAAGEQNRDEMKGMQQAMGGPLIESPYGDPVESEKAPEAISKAVASLPPEQMFELMKQMKMCIQNNPTEARNMLLQNPQLAYALLQAQIVMKIVDPQVAMAMLHRESNQIPPTGTAASVPSSVAQQQVKPQQAGPALGAVPSSMASQIPMQIQQGVRGNMGPGPSGPPMGAGPGPRMGLPAMGGIPDLMGPSRGAMMGNIVGGPPIRSDMGPSIPDIRDLRLMSDPRSAPSGPPGGLAGPPGLGGPGLGLANLGKLNLSGGLPNLSGGAQISAQDQEKAALIMQVLQLTDQQIGMLPPDQRQSILFLKDQIAKSATT